MAPRGVYNSVIIEYNVKNGTFIEPDPYIFKLIVPRYTADCENFADVPAEDVSDHDDIPDDDIPDDDIPDDIPNDDMPDDILDDVADDIPQDMQDNPIDSIPEDIPDDISDRMSIESEGKKASASVFVDVADEADTSYYRASKASKVDNTLDGRCAVQRSGR
jgi:hypothetical protein